MFTAKDTTLPVGTNLQSIAGFGAIVSSGLRVLVQEATPAKVVVTTVLRTNFDRAVAESKGASPDRGYRIEGEVNLRTTQCPDAFDMYCRGTFIARFKVIG